MLSQHYYVQVKKLAIETVKKRKGDVQNELDVQGEYLLQFGKYRGQSFRWMLENAPSYIGWFVDNIRNEKVTKSPISQNKAALKKYVESFQEGRDVVALKKKQREDKEPKKQHSSPQPSQNSASKKVVSPMAAGLASGHISTKKYLSWVASTTGVEKFKPTILVSVRKKKTEDTFCHCDFYIYMYSRCR